MIYDALKHKEIYQTWELQQLTTSWMSDRIDSVLVDNENVDRLYARAIQLQTQNSYCFVMPSHMFYRWVENGSLVDYDGSGVFLDWEGNRQGHIRCNEKWLEERIEKFPFVMWFNK